MAMGPRGRARRNVGQPTNLNVIKAGGKNINRRQNGELMTTQKKGNRVPAQAARGYGVKKIGTPYNLPDVPTPPGL